MAMGDQEQQDEHWTVRRQKAALCKVHNLHYDPRLTSGCILCRKEGDTEPPPKPQFLNLLLIILALVMVVAKVFVSATSAPVPATVIEEAVPDEALRLDPELFRPALTAVDTSLYASRKSEIAVMGEDLRAALTTLERELLESPLAAAPTAADDVRELIDKLPDILDLGFLQNVREAWPPLRAANFARASWFRYPVASHGEDRAVLAAYQDVTSNLAGLVEDAASHAEVLSEPVMSGFGDTGDETARREQQWASSGAEFRQRLEALRSRLPDRPDTSAGAGFLVATQALEKAFAQVASSVVGGLAGADGRLEAAREAVAEAQQAFDNLVYQ
jgi:hypothetical protein